MFNFTLKNGKVIQYTEDYVIEGVIFYIQSEITKSEYEEFKKTMNYERDVVRIYNS